MNRLTRLAVLASISIAPPALAATLTPDPIDDFELSYVGPHVADGDITGVGVSLEGGVFTLTATVDGALGTTPGAFYVWGIDRGAGVPRLTFVGTPPAIRPDLDFDAVYLTFLDGTSELGIPQPMGPPVFTDYTGLVHFSGDTLTATLPAQWLPSTGFDLSHYQFTVWSHIPETAGDTSANNDRIADFSPTITPQVPEPATWMLMSAGFGLLGGAMRRRPETSKSGARVATA